MEQDPSTIRQTDNVGNLPIHRICVSRTSMPKVKDLLRRYDKGSAAILNYQGRSLFVVAVFASASLDFHMYLMKVDTVIALASLRVSSLSPFTDK